MKESVPGAGRDDVLDSIRKLVQAAPNSPLKEGAKPRETPTTDKLLLTPALRVSDPEEVASEPENPAPSISLEQRIAELEAAVGSQIQDWEPDGSESQDQHRPEAALRVVSDNEWEEESTESVPLVLTDEIAPPDAKSMEQAETPGELDAVDEAQLSEPELDETEDTDISQSTAQDALFLSRRHRVDDEAAPTDQVIEEETEETGNIAEFRSVQRETLDDNEPENDSLIENERNHSDEEDYRDHEEPHLSLVETQSDEPVVDVSELDIGELASEQPEQEKPFDPKDVAESEDTINENELREVVRQVLREELGGEIGEKMTRNIRRMLRQEIDRALSLREFD